MRASPWTMNGGADIALDAMNATAVLMLIIGGAAPQTLTVIGYIGTYSWQLANAVNIPANSVNGLVLQRNNLTNGFTASVNPAAGNWSPFLILPHRIQFIGGNNLSFSYTFLFDD